VATGRTRDALLVQVGDDSSERATSESHVEDAAYNVGVDWISFKARLCGIRPMVAVGRSIPGKKLPTGHPCPASTLRPLADLLAFKLGGECFRAAQECTSGGLLEVLRNKRERCASGFDPINQNRGIGA
jgi:hypothetical protein